MATTFEPAGAAAPEQAAPSNWPEWADVTDELQQRYADKNCHGATVEEAGKFFDSLPRESRNHHLRSLERCDGSQEAEAERIAANVDRDTRNAFDALTSHVAGVADVAAPEDGGPVWGAPILDAVEDFLKRFVAYPSEAARVAHVAWIAHTHRMDVWENTPRIAFLSPEPASGKSRALEVTELLVPNPVLSVNATPAYLFRKAADQDNRPTVLYDEIDTVYGPAAHGNEELRGFINAGHRKGETAGRCVVRGKTVETEELDAYCAVALAGLNDLPDTIMTRSIAVRMRKRAPHERVEPFRRREHSAQGQAIKEALAEWAETIPVGQWPAMPAEVQDRDADVWEALFVVADAAGGDWPKRIRDAAVTFITDATDKVPSLGVQLLSDIQGVFAKVGQPVLTTEALLTHLHNLLEAPWGDLRGKPLDARGLADRLRNYQIQPKSIRVGGRVVRGYDRSDFIDAWDRYLQPSQKSATAATSATGQATA